MVASAILALLTLIGVFLVEFGGRSTQKVDSSTETFRQGSQAISRLRREMRGAQILEPLENESTELLYNYPELEGKELVVDAAGRPLLSGPARIFLDEGILKLEKPLGEPIQILAKLGDEGRFLVTPTEEFFQVLVTVKSKGQESPGFRRRLRLARPN